MRLPEEFTERMKKELLSSGITEDGFFESFDSEGLKGIRINQSKVGPDGFDKVLNDIDPDGIPQLNSATLIPGTNLEPDLNATSSRWLTSASFLILKKVLYLLRPTLILGKSRKILR